MNLNLDKRSYERKQRERERERGRDYAIPQVCVYVCMYLYSRDDSGAFRQLPLSLENAKWNLNSVG